MHSSVFFSFWFFSAAVFAAFNTYDVDTFADSSCMPLEIEIPSGFFASPTGDSQAAGTLDDPLDLATALSVESVVGPGDTLWLLPGSYNGTFSSELQGSESFPIQVKPYPGTAAIIDTTGSETGSGLRINGSWVDYHGLEILSRESQRQTLEDGSNPSDIQLRSGVDIYGRNNRVINFIAHDNAGGINAWYKGVGTEDSEIYGSIIYNNGWSAPGRGHGHAIYAQNRGGIKRITDNIIFFGFGTGVHVYTENGSIDNFSVQGNAWFLTGASDGRASQKKDNCLVGGFQPVKNLLLKNNLGYSDNGRGTRLGYGGSVVGQTAVMENNYLAENLWIAGNWDQLDVSDTTVLHGITGSSQNQIDDLGGNDFREIYDSPGDNKIFISKNDHDPRRARVVIYNYTEDDVVAVDLSGVLQIGAAYRIHSVFDLFGEPLLSGVYDGMAISLPMGQVPPPQPNGFNGIDPGEDDPGKRYGVFVVTHAACSVNYEVDAICGSSHGSQSETKPSTNLCYRGSAESVSGSGPWQWPCIGENGGSDAICSTDALGCLSSPVLVQDTLYSAAVTRESEISIHTRGSVVVETGVDVLYRAPIIGLTAGFVVESGAQFSIDTGQISCGL